jgi:hypothetical protein
MPHGASGDTFVLEVCGCCLQLHCERSQRFRIANSGLTPATKRRAELGSGVGVAATTNVSPTLFV